MSDTHEARFNALLEAARVAEIKLRDGGVYPIKGETWRALRDALLPYKGLASTPAPEETAYKEDAERYRWLKAKHSSGDDQWFVYGAKSDDLDQEIDAARREPQRDTEGKS